jgi:mannonate dehydratase
MGRLGIPVWCYNWMPVVGWVRTTLSARGRGGAIVSAYDHAQMVSAPPTWAGTVEAETLWTNLRWFLERVCPVAEEAGVTLALHPDDPPLSPLRGIGRIMRSLDAFQRVIDMADSPYNGITLCQGNFALMTGDLPAAIRHFGRQNKIFFVHMRDVHGTPDKFVETFHDDGPTDMLAAMRGYHALGFAGPMRPDHVPTLAGDANDPPGYTTRGRLYAIGYMRGLREAVRAGG